MAFQTGLEGKPWYVGAAVGLVLAAAIVVPEAVGAERDLDYLDIPAFLRRQAD